MGWSPDRYLRFADHRARPGLELMARIPEVEATSVFDLGCGPGTVTPRLAGRWPRARTIGIDSSVEMIERARADHPGLEFQEDDIATWVPDDPVDVIFSNAALHWLDHHGRLFPRLIDFLRPGGVLAVQMPNNWSAPTHTIPATVLAGPSWTEAQRRLLITDRVDDPADYRRYLIDRAASLDLWQTTYYQELTGVDPVFEWTSGSLLGPVLSGLDADDRRRFVEAVVTGYREAYPADHTGTVLLPYTRLFIVAMRA